MVQRGKHSLNVAHKYTHINYSSFAFRMFLFLPVKFVVKQNKIVPSWIISPENFAYS